MPAQTKEEDNGDIDRAILRLVESANALDATRTVQIRFYGIWASIFQRMEKDGMAPPRVAIARPQRAVIVRPPTKRLA